MRIAIVLLALGGSACGGPTTSDMGLDLGGDAGSLPTCSTHPATTAEFEDRFPTSGISVGGTSWPIRVGPTNGAAIADCDLDGLPDAFVFNWIGDGRLWHNDGDFHFSDVTAAAGFSIAFPNGGAFADLDDDGLPDLVVTLGIHGMVAPPGDGGAPLPNEVRVYRNRGGCRFEDVSVAWGFGPHPTAPALVTGTSLYDFNLDGRVDVVVTLNQDPAATPWFYVSQPDGTWRDEGATIFGTLGGSAWGTFPTDVDDDGRADLFVLFDGRMGPPAHFLRRLAAVAPPWFTEVQDALDTRYFGASADVASLMAGASADVDGDGLLDIYLGDLGPSHLYVHRSGQLVDRARELGAATPTLPDGSPTLSFGGSFADYDNDSWPDLAVVAGTDDGYFAPPNAFLLHNNGDGSFEDRTPLLGQMGPHAAHWMTASDLDRDGRADYWFGGLAMQPLILHNQVRAGHSLAVRLRGRTSNADGIGSKVTVQVGARRLVAEMYGGGAPWGYGEHRLLFGLGCADSASAIDVHWPDGYVQHENGPFAAATSDVVVEEPEWLRVEPTVVAPGAPSTITVRPAAADGTPLGSGHRVEVTMDPGGVALAVSDDGRGGYTATAQSSVPGIIGVTVRIDGTDMLAHPRVLVR